MSTPTFYNESGVELYAYVRSAGGAWEAATNGSPVGRVANGASINMTHSTAPGGESGALFSTSPITPTDAVSAKYVWKSGLAYFSGKFSLDLEDSDTSSNDWIKYEGSYNSPSIIVSDAVAPTIIEAVMNHDNTYATITFSEAVYDTNGGSGVLEAADFALAITGGSATCNATPSALTNTSGGAAVEGATQYRVYLDGITEDTAATGFEALAIGRAGATSIYDAAGNAMEAAGAITVYLHARAAAPNANAPRQKVAGSQISLSGSVRGPKGGIVSQASKASGKSGLRLSFAPSGMHDGSSISISSANDLVALHDASDGLVKSVSVSKLIGSGLGGGQLDVGSLDATGSVKGDDITARDKIIASGSIQALGAISGSSALIIAGTSTLHGEVLVKKDAQFERNVIVTGSFRAASLSGPLDANSKAITNINVDSGAIDGITLGTNSAVTQGVITSLTASHALIHNLNAVNINTQYTSEEYLMIEDKYLHIASGSKSADADGAGLLIGGWPGTHGSDEGDDGTTFGSGSYAEVLWDHTNQALDFNIVTASAGGVAATQVRLQDGEFLPEVNNDVDLGTAANRWANVYSVNISGSGNLSVAGTAHFDGTMEARSGSFTGVVASSGSFEALHGRAFGAGLQLDNGILNIQMAEEVFLQNSSSNVARTFTLAESPIAASVACYVNGLMQAQGATRDYTVGGTGNKSLTFNAASGVEQGAELIVKYIKA